MCGHGLTLTLCVCCGWLWLDIDAVCVVDGHEGWRLTLYVCYVWSGMDPAEPYFQNTDKVVRLDPSDALFVDVIHTDGASFFSTDLGD